MSGRLRPDRSPDRCCGPIRGRPSAVATREFGIDDLADVRELVRRCAHDSLGTRESDLVLAVHELATNSIRHAHGHGVVRLWTTDEHVICEVSDSGHLVDVLAGRRGASQDAGSGRGLWLVHELCDLVQTRSGPDGTCTRVRMRTART